MTDEPDLTPRPEHELPPIDPPPLQDPVQPEKVGRKLQVSLGIFIGMLALTLGSLLAVVITVTHRQDSSQVQVQDNKEALDAIAAQIDARAKFRTDASCADLAADIDFFLSFRDVIQGPRRVRLDSAVRTKVQLRQVQNCPPPPGPPPTRAPGQP